MASVDKKPVCLNYEYPCKDCMEPILFKDVKRSYVIGEDIVLKYSTIKSYSPKGDDWVGLFRCNPEADNVFEYVAFEWAQKKPSFKNKPLERCVTFNLDNIDLTDDIYIFLYLTLQERIIGQSPRFKFKFYMEKTYSNTRVKSQTGTETAEQAAEVKKPVNIVEVEKEEPGKNQDNSDKIVDLPKPHPRNEEKKETNQKSVNAVEINELLDKNFDDLSMKNSFLKMRVNRIEDLASNILTLQKALQDQMLQCMMVVEASWNLRGINIKELIKNEVKNIHHPKKQEPKVHKNIKYYFPDFDTASIFSGSSQTFRHLFSDDNEEQKAIKSDNKTQADVQNDIVIKKAVTDVEAFTDNKSKENDDNANEVVSDTKKSKSLQHNREILKPVNGGMFKEEEVKSKSPDSDKQNNDIGKQEMKIYKNSFLDKNIVIDKTTLDKATQMPSVGDLQISSDKNSLSIKILLNDANVLPCIVVSESDRVEGLVVDVTQDNSVIIQPVPLHAVEEKAKLLIKKNASTMTSEMENNAILVGKEKLLASTSHPNNAEGWLKNCVEKEENSSENIPPSTDVSMAVQVGSLELANPLLESSPAATRLALLDSYEMLTNSQKNFARNVTAKRCTAAKITLMKAILESNLTDEEKVSSVGLIYLNDKNAGRSFRKQFPAQSAPIKLFDKTTSTEYETSDTGETSTEIDDLINFDFQKKNRRSRKLKRNKFGRNKFTQTEPEIPTIINPVIDESSKFPKLVKRPLPTSIILSDSRNSFAASSEDDVKAKPILKKSSPVSTRSKDGSQSPKKASVTFLLDATTQCDLGPYEKLDNFGMPAESSNQANNEAMHEDYEDIEMQEIKRERKVSFNTIILTSLFDNEEADKDDPIILVDEAPVHPKIDGHKKQNIPPIHQFLDLIEMEAKLMSQSMIKIQNTISNAVRVFKTEAITLKDISADVLNKAIKSLTLLKFGQIENQDSTSSTTPDENIPLIQKNIQEDSKRTDHLNSPEQKDLPINPKPKQIVDINKIRVSADKKQETQPVGKSPLPSKNKDADATLYRSILKDINAEILEKVRLNEIVKIQVSDTDLEQSNDPEINNPSEDSKENDTASSASHPIKPESLLSGPADLRDFWDFNFGTYSGKRTYSTVPQTSMEDSPLASLSIPSDNNYQSPHSLDTQSMVTSCFSGNQMQMRFPGLMLVRSFDSTISNIVNLYNTFTSFAYSSLTNRKDSSKQKMNSPIINDDLDMIRQTYDISDNNISEGFKSYENGIGSDQIPHFGPNLISDGDDDMIKTLKTIRMMEIERKDSQLDGNKPLDLSTKTSPPQKQKDEMITPTLPVKDEQLCLTCSDEFPRLLTEATNPITGEKAIPSKRKNQSRKKKRKED